MDDGEGNINIYPINIFMSIDVKITIIFMHFSV